MKKIVFKRLRNLFLIVMAVAVVTSCKKESKTSSEPTCSGKPVITKISTTTDRTEDNTGGSLSDWIIIQGSNLCGAKKIMFNDVEVDLSTAYITPTEITVAIPRGIPTVVNDQVTLSTKGGDATFSYTVSVPNLIVTGMYNEYTPAGATMTITGKNFDLYELNPENGKVIFGGAEIAIDRSTADSIFFKVPTAATVNSQLKLKDKRGIETVVPGKYKDNRGMIYNMDGPSDFFWNHDRLTIQDGPIPAPISGKYVYWHGVYNDGKEWDWDEHFHVVQNTKLADAGVIGSSSNYLIKFEINVLNEWSKDYMRIKMFGQDYEWRPYSNLPFTTSGWKTITIPFSVFKDNGAPIDISQTQANGSTEVRLYIHGKDKMDVKIALDNFRIVPKN